VVSKQDYYEILEVHRTASLQEIKKAYRQKAIKYHPDKNPDDKVAEDKFKELTEAYSVLSDEQKRAQYDKFGHSAFSQQGSGFEGFDGAGFEDIFGDIFSSFFGGASSGNSSRGGRSRGKPGRDLRYDLQLTFEEAAFGAEKEISFTRPSLCDVCNGSGVKPGTSPKTCPDCNGSGQIRMQQGFFAVSRTCGRCSGAGQIITDPCMSCGGSGLKNKQVTLSVKVPPGIDDGQRLKMRGEGEAGKEGAPPGDLYVRVLVKEHPIFRREEGSEIVCDIPITFAQAVLGDEVDVPTLEGSVKMKIPPGTQSGKVFRMKNRGIQVLGTNRRGDQHTRVNIEVPKKLSEERKELLTKLRELEIKEDQDGEPKGFFDKVKEMFA
jgi:molecular chaperone DnaJ